MYKLLTHIPVPNPSDSKGMITDEYIDFLNGSRMFTKAKTLDFEINSLKKKVSFKVSDIIEQSYLIVGPSHFKDIKTGEIVIHDIHNPSISIDSTKFQKATQVEFDFYQSVLNSNNDNCKLYNLINSIVQMNESDNESDDDPYYRGNINDFLKL